MWSKTKQLMLVWKHLNKRKPFSSPTTPRYTTSIYWASLKSVFHVNIIRRRPSATWPSGLGRWIWNLEVPGSHRQPPTSWSIFLIRLSSISTTLLTSYTRHLNKVIFYIVTFFKINSNKQDSQKAPAILAISPATNWRGYIKHSQ